MTASASLGLLLAVAGMFLLIAAVILDFEVASTRAGQYTPLLVTVVAISMILAGVWFFTH